MLNLLGRPLRYCDGISRRSFLKIGALGAGAGALTLADIFRAEAAAGSRSQHKAVVLANSSWQVPALLPFLAVSIIYEFTANERVLKRGTASLWEVVRFM